MVSSLIDTLLLTKAESDGDLDLCFLDLALALADKGEGQVNPNPLVGSVIVKDGVVVGQGFHRYDRVKHAEVLALEQAGPLAKDATVYLNLEPCCHRGNGKRTPPCTDALIQAGVKRVVCCITDPNPRVNGRGVAVLREAGIAVTVGPRTSAARILNAEYLRSVITSNTSPTLSLMQMLFLILIFIPEFSAMPNATDDKDPQFQATPSKTAGFVAHNFLPRSIAVERTITWQ